MAVATWPPPRRSRWAARSLPPQSGAVGSTQTSSIEHSPNPMTSSVRPGRFSRSAISSRTLGLAVSLYYRFDTMSLDAAHVAFEAGDFAEARRLAGQLLASASDEPTRSAATDLLKRTAIDPLIL